MPSPLIGDVFSAVDHGDHIIVDCEVLIGDAMQRVNYVVRPASGDTAPAHVAIEAMIDAEEIEVTEPE